MLRPDVMLNVALWIANSVAWLYNGSIGMTVLSMLGVLSAVMIGRLSSD